MRGKRDEDGESREVERITPAHAGKTLFPDVALILAADHPRACGENSRMQGMRKVTNGSPPRMRGKLSP